jgi:hypothetical protein
MVIIINLDGDEEVHDDVREEQGKKERENFLPEAYHFPQPQLVPIAGI